MHNYKSWVSSLSILRMMLEIGYKTETSSTTLEVPKRRRRVRSTKKWKTVQSRADKANEEHERGVFCVFARLAFCDLCCPALSRRAYVFPAQQKNWKNNDKVRNKPKGNNKNRQANKQTLMCEKLGQTNNNPNTAASWAKCWQSARKLKKKRSGDALAFFWWVP